MEKGRQQERPTDEERLSRQRDDQRSPARSRELAPGDAAGGELASVVDEPPLEREEAVEEPYVQVLETMVPPPRLPRREAQQRAAGLDVRIEPGHVRVCVVHDVVLEAPEERARAQQIERERHDSVHARARGRSEEHTSE